MKETTVTRNGQITITKEIREKLDIKEGDVLIINLVGETIIVSKRNPLVFEKGNFLPDNFSKLLSEIRKLSLNKRFERLGITR